MKPLKPKPGELKQRMSEETNCYGYSIDLDEAHASKPYQLFMRECEKVYRTNRFLKRKQERDQ